MSSMPMRKLSVLIVDDSAVVRQVLTALLSADDAIEVQAAVADPLFAIKRMAVKWPDVIVLDIEMPRMDGLTFLRKIMAERPTPVVICSTLTEAGADITFQALNAGAVSIITKPRTGLSDYLHDSADNVVAAVKAAARARLANVRANPIAEPLPSPVPARPLGRTTRKVVAIGTSTGGTQALERILTALPAVSPGILIVQHMPETFTALFAKRLDGLCRITVKEAETGDRVLPGTALIAPGGRHMQLRRSGAQYRVEVGSGPLVNRHRPSVDVLFRSVAREAGANAAGFLLTGMGDDGACGLKAMKDAGAYTVAQDEASCVVFGMPKEAIALGAAVRVLPLTRMAGEILACVSEDHGPAAVRHDLR